MSIRNNQSTFLNFWNLGIQIVMSSRALEEPCKCSRIKSVDYFHQGPVGLECLDEAMKTISLEYYQKRLIVEEAVRRRAWKGKQNTRYYQGLSCAATVGVQKVDEASDDTKDVLSKPPLPESLAAISTLNPFSLSRALLSRSIKRSPATLQTSSPHEM